MILAGGKQSYNVGVRRPWLIATFVLTAALTLSWAQRGGMRGGASGGRGFASHGGMRTGAMTFARAPRTSMRFGTTFRPPDRNPHGFHRRRFITRFPRWYAGYYPGYYGGYYSPFYGDWYGSSSDSSASDYVQQQTARQIDDLRAEVQRLQEERDYSRPPEEYPQAPVAAVPRPPTDTRLESDLPIVLVFLDKRIQEVKNYAVMNETLVVFDGTRSRRIPLADVDLAATMKLNDERGVDFQIPN
ncbi:MAG TPA: hypothetical protein VNY29_07835 [Terriglobales bacterium]|nr:hypothetical protein [Terriglobales bacterium]